MDIEIQMPREGQVNLRTGDGKIDIGGFKGEMDLHSGDGSEKLTASTANCAPQPATATYRPRPL